MDQCCSTRSGLNPSRVHLDTRDEINLILGLPRYLWGGLNLWTNLSFLIVTLLSENCQIVTC